MSQHESRTGSLVISLKTLKGEQTSPSPSLNNTDDKNDAPTVETVDTNQEQRIRPETKILKAVFVVNKGISEDEVNLMLKEKEETLRAEFEITMSKEVNALKERFDFILQNEQVRATHMLLEAHRERQEKINALQTQFECKNLAGLMFVMCAERRKAKLEKLRLIEEYTNYINALKTILSDGQELILDLSRGYKTAARVDDEWRRKMKEVLKVFLSFIHDFCGGTDYLNQYLVDVPQLLHTNAPITDDPEENPCDDDDQPVVVEEIKQDKSWWETLDDEGRPFIMFGDLADFKPDERREIVKTAKSPRTAPRKWKEYMFDEMFVKDECSNLDTIKDEIIKFSPKNEKWDCIVQPTIFDSKTTLKEYSKSGSNGNRRITTTSIDNRGTMGSILKIVTHSNYGHPAGKEHLLGARDSMEIASNTRLLQKKGSRHPNGDGGGVVIDLGKYRNSSVFSEDESLPRLEDKKIFLRDSKDFHSNHKPDVDHVINYEKICPMEDCQRMEMDSFTRALPPYMKANPFTQFLQTFEEYEALTPEQLEVLLARIEEKREKERGVHVPTPPLQEWAPDGVGCQTSDLTIGLPPCSCFAPSPTPVSSVARILDARDIWDIKKKIDSIKSNCFFDDRIDFDRFEVVGQMEKFERKPTKLEEMKEKSRYHDITRILRDFPSLCEIFQGNTN